MKITTRDDLGWPSGTFQKANTNLGMIAHFDGNKGLMSNWEKNGHKACLDYWRATRSFHINGNKWQDIGYAYMVCPCGTVLEGRGFGKQQAAEGPTPGKRQNGNTRYVAVTFGTGPGEMPTDNAIAGFRALRHTLMANHGIAGDVYGHRDFTSTDCPGDVIYKLVRNKVLASAGKQPEDDEMKLPTLRKGTDKKYDVLTLRALLYQRFLAGTKPIPDNASIDDLWQLISWMRREEFDDALETDVKAYQELRKLDADGIVGDKTWAELTRTAK